jgi:hypothetical protein
MDALKSEDHYFPKGAEAELEEYLERCGVRLLPEELALEPGKGLDILIYHEVCCAAPEGPCTCEPVVETSTAKDKPN